MAQQQSGFSGITKPKKKASYEGGPLKNVGPGNRPLATFLGATGVAPAAPLYTPPAGDTGGSTPPPIDPIYEQQKIDNVHTYGDTDLGLVGTRDRGLTSLGYKAAFDPNDPFAVTPGSLAYDPNNPFSQASLLRQHYQEAQRGHTNQLASQGQQYSGALGNQLGYDTQAFQQGDDTLQKSAGGLIADAIQNHRINLTNLGTNNTTALGASVGRQGPSATPDATAGGLTAEQGAYITKALAAQKAAKAKAKVPGKTGSAVGSSLAALVAGSAGAAAGKAGRR